MFDELETLLKEAIASELRNRRGRGTVCRLEEIKRVCHQTYADPANWTAGSLIELTHRETGSFLGYFRELTHNRVPARKLVRASDPAGEAAVVQFVEGDLWLGDPFQHTVDPLTEGEQAAVRAYYQPHYWRPKWKHKRPGTLTRKSAEELMKELMQ